MTSVSHVRGGHLPQAVSGAREHLSPDQLLTQLFQKIDTDSAGSITQDQLAAALPNMKLPPAIKAMGADAIFQKLDPNGTGSVSQADFVSGMAATLSVGHRVRSSGGDAAASASGNGGNQWHSAATALSGSLLSLMSARETTWGHGGGAGGGHLSPEVSAPSRPLSPDQVWTQTFQQIDTGNTGSITQDQLTTAFPNLTLPPAVQAMGADAVFQALDPNETGSVSQADFVSGMKGLVAYPTRTATGVDSRHRADNLSNRAASTPHGEDSRLTRLFQRIDTGNTGSITPDQLATAFPTLRLPSAIQAMGSDAVFQTLDPNETGSVSQADFVSGMKALMAQNATSVATGVDSRSRADNISGRATGTSYGLANRLTRLFQQIDTDSTGSITPDQLATAFPTLRLPSAIQAMGSDAVFQALDPNETGSVAQADFVSGLKSLIAQNATSTGVGSRSRAASTSYGLDNRLTRLFRQIDTESSGSITQDQLATAFPTLRLPSAIQAMGSDTLFQTLDPNETGSVSQADFISGIKSLIAQNATSPSGDGSSTPSRLDNRLTRLFQQIDTESTGSITQDQLATAFPNLTLPSAIQAMGSDALFQALDPNGTGSVSQADFVSGVKALVAQNASTSNDNRWTQLFQQIDTENTGSITQDQLETAFKDRADAIFQQLDPNGTGSVSLEDFVNGMKGIAS
ncbi:MAG: EF-hand domain-containing protein [Magnetococcales bacterium]|nr:EF-hand domain-containing protein [Magnetococcales bacterium]